MGQHRADLLAQRCGVAGVWCPDPGVAQRRKERVVGGVGLRRRRPHHAGSQHAGGKGKGDSSALHPGIVASDSRPGRIDSVRHVDDLGLLRRGAVDFACDVCGDEPLDLCVDASDDPEQLSA